MIPIQLLFLAFILIVFFLLILLALDINFLTRLFSNEESWSFTKTSSHKKDVEDINNRINLYVQAKSLLEKLIRICPANAIDQAEELNELIKISESRCLGYSCSECLRLVLHQNMEKSE